MRRAPLYLVVLLLAVCSVPAAALVQTVDLPTGWFKGGRPAENYETGIDSKTRRGSQPSVFVRAATAAPGGFGTIMQVQRAGAYRGKRVRLSGYIKAANVHEWAGFWLRIDPADPDQQALAFENMSHRPVKGSTDWGRHEIVIDVPEQAAFLYFGLLLAGGGEVWASEVGLEVVGPHVPLTGAGRSCCGGGPQ